MRAVRNWCWPGPKFQSTPNFLQHFTFLLDIRQDLQYSVVQSVDQTEQGIWINGEKDSDQWITEETPLKSMQSKIVRFLAKHGRESLSRLNTKYPRAGPHW